MAHGYAKLIKHPDNFIAILHALGVPMPHFMAWATIEIELVGGFLVLIGGFIPVVAVPMLVVLRPGRKTRRRPAPEDTAQTATHAYRAHETTRPVCRRNSYRNGAY
jgi:hypothetical protein